MDPNANVNCLLFLCFAFRQMYIYCTKPTVLFPIEIMFSVVTLRHSGEVHMIQVRYVNVSMSKALRHFSISNIRLPLHLLPIHSLALASN